MIGAEMSRVLSVVGVCVLLLAMFGCSNDQYAGEGAAQGAKSGAIAGAVSGAVGSLIWGGNPLEGAAVGAAMGGAGGATVGAMHGSGKDKQIKQEVGDANYRAIMYLADCLHDKAREQLADGFASDNENYVIASYWIDAVIAEDERDGAELKEKVEAIIAHDPDYSDPDDTRIEVKMLAQRLQQVRRDFGKPMRCN